MSNLLKTLHKAMCAQYKQLISKKQKPIMYMYSKAEDIKHVVQMSFASAAVKMDGIGHAIET